MLGQEDFMVIQALVRRGVYVLESPFCVMRFQEVGCPRSRRTGGPSASGRRRSSAS